jgi:opacity protein-like surface antigen
MTVTGWCNLILLGIVACGAAAPGAADDSTPAVPVSGRQAAVEVALPALAELLETPATKVRRNGPDWVKRISAAIFERQDSASDDWHVALQRDRTDGAEMLTVRHPLPALGPVETYAGAGVNRSVYFAESNLEPTVLSNHNRRRTLGAAAELGAELRLSDRLMMRADLRWIDLADDANILRDDDALVGADPVALGVSVGWRFP